MASAGRAGAPLGAGDSVVLVDAAATADGGSKGGSAAPALEARAAPPRPRAHYIDWLRVVLTVMVLVHHTFNTYTGAEPWWFAHVSGAKDPLLGALQMAIVTSPSMHTAMCLFFFMAGVFTPSSVRRKGRWHHLLDRAIRLLIPTLLFACVIYPLLLEINRVAGITPDNPSALAFVRDVPDFGRLWAGYFVYVFNLGNGPMWFVYMLFWLDVGYVACHWLGSAWARVCSRRRAPGRTDAAAEGRDGQRPHAAAPPMPVAGPAAARAPTSACAGAGELPMPHVLAGGAALIAAFTLTSWGALLATFNSPHVMSFDDFFRPCPVIVFKPSWFGPNVISFVLGTQAPRLGLLARLPARLGVWCLCVGALWWAEAVMMVDLIAKPPVAWGEGGQRLNGWTAGWLLWHKFAEWAFAVVWGAGLLVAFREAFNAAPGRVGRLVIAGAYGAFILHPLLIALWCWALDGVPFVSTAGNALAASPLVVASSWLATLVVRLLPGAKRVLG